jgi:hypothetical protein
VQERQISAASAPRATTTAAAWAPGQLNGTGFQIAEGGCGANNTTGGGTGWLKMAGNVVPGQTMEIRFAIWDTGDGIYDSLVLLDDWVWSVQASQPGVTPN